MLNPSYFKPRGRFDFHPHRYEIGNLFSFNQKLENNFFFKKLRNIEQSEHQPFFYFHQQYYLAQHPQQQKQFLKHVLDLVEHRIEDYRLKGFYTDAEQTLTNLEILNAFKAMLIELDEWSLHKSLEIQLVEKDIEIASCRQEIKALKSTIKTASKYDAESKIRIIEGTLPALIDLVQQMQVLTLPDKRKFFSVQSQSAWYKMIGKYFQNGEKDIPLDTLRNYFPASKPEDLIKGTGIAEANKLFTINRIIPKKP